MAVVKELIGKTKERFDKAGIDAPAFNTLCLIEKAFGITQNDIISDSKLSVGDTGYFDELVKRRLRGEPLQYILGEWYFYGLRFKVGKGVLIPRDDTEVLLRACLDFLKNKPSAKVIDLCSGSGALAAAIAKNTDSEVYAVELSDSAFPYLNENIRLNKASVKAVNADVTTCFDEFEDGFFDLILSNPPYIKSDEIPNLQTEVGFEPEMALDGGIDGLSFYRSIIKSWTKKLKRGGAMAFELGEGQYEDVAAMMKSADFQRITPHLDFGDVQRAVIGTLTDK